MANTVYFVRHGQTFFNLYNRMQGWSDTPLTAKGIEDAERAGKALAKLDIDYVFSSDLKRAVDTANIILKNHPNTKIKKPIQDPAFREEFFGYFEGEDNGKSAVMVSAPEKCSNFREIGDKYGIKGMRDMIASHDPYHNAEDDHAFWQRVNKGLDRLRSLPDGSVAIVVSHGMTIRSLVSHFNDDKFEGGPLNGSITKFTLDNDNTTIDFYNQLQLPK